MHPHRGFEFFMEVVQDLAGHGWLAVSLLGGSVFLQMTTAIVGAFADKGGHKEIGMLIGVSGLVVGYLAFVVGCALIAHEKGRSWFLGSALGLLHVVGLVILLKIPDRA